MMRPWSVALFGSLLTLSVGCFRIDPLSVRSDAGHPNEPNEPNEPLEPGVRNDPKERPGRPGTPVDPIVPGEESPTPGSDDIIPSPGVVVTNPVACDFDVVIRGLHYELDVATLLGRPTCAANVTLTIERGASIGARHTSRAALRIADLPQGSVVVLDNRGNIAGAGGRGGSGGNGGSGSPYCGRPGEPGGTALRLEVETIVRHPGAIYGGGGGGGGVSGGNVAMGGGGGAGMTGGAGGAPNTVLSEAAELAHCGQDNGLRAGSPGLAGTRLLPGPAVARDEYCRSGAGGAPGKPGEASDCFGNASGGEAGPAISWPVDVTVSFPTSGTRDIRGPIVEQ